jgi:23S rRNA (cytosine1962-C5)-methyltransferase
MITKNQWIDAALLRDFEAEGTDAHRLCTIEDGWVERFGRDVLISFKKVLARERLIQELQSWASIVRFELGRIFARFVPRKNE